MIKIYIYDDDNDDDQAPCKSFIVGSAWLTDAREGWRTYLVRFALTLGQVSLAKVQKSYRVDVEDPAVGGGHALAVEQGGDRLVPHHRTRAVAQRA